MVSRRYSRFIYGIVIFVLTASGARAISPATLTLVTSSSPAIYGTPVVLSASIVPGAATGKITFYDGATILGIVPLSSGTAVLSTILLPSGNRELKAYYSGDSDFASVTSNVVPFMVNAKPANLLGPASSGANLESHDQISIAAGDFNGDNRADLAISIDGNVIILTGNGDGTFQLGASYPVGLDPGVIAIGDFNGDGNTDLAVATTGDNNLNILLGNGDGTFRPATHIAVGVSPVSLVIADFNGDGKSDIAVSNYNGTAMTILLGNGDGTFQESATPPSTTYSTGVAAGDFNGDGNVDLLVCEFDGSTVIGSWRPSSAAPAS